jgi:3-phenylpropionate/cinnamic acid dioxygenase small subunit
MDMPILFQPARLLLIVLVSLLSGTVATADEAPRGALQAALGPSQADARDRVEILGLIGLYSHLADSLQTDLWGEFFTEDALFRILPPASSPEGAPEPIVWRGRSEIVAAIRPRHEAFRRRREQRRHFITNPVVWHQTEDSARVAAYLQLVSSVDGGPARMIGTGRYEGRAIRTETGWRMAEWTIHSDQHMADAERPKEPLGGD